MNQTCWRKSLRRLSQLAFVGLWALSLATGGFSAEVGPFASQSTSQSASPSANRTFVVIIDGIEVHGSVHLKPETLAQELDIPIGTEVSVLSVSDLLKDIELKMTASGKFKKSLSVRLQRGGKPQHYVVVIFAEPLNDWYKGLSLILTNSPGELGGGSNGGYLHSGILSLFAGNRDVGESGWAFDLDFSNLGLQYSYNNSEFYFETGFYRSSGSGEFVTQMVTMSAINSSSFNGHFYYGGLTRLTNSITWSNFEGSSRFSFQDNVTTSRSSQSEVSKDYSGSLEGLIGIKARGFSLGGRYSRESSKTYYRRSNSHSFTNDVENKASGYSIYSSDDSQQKFSGEANLSLQWSLKPGVGLVELGPSMSVNWQRSYSEHGKPEPVSTIGMGSYTCLLAPQMALTGTAKHQWSYENLDYPSEKLSVQKILQLGAMVEHFSTDGEVYYFEFNRSGVARQFLHEGRGRNDGRHITSGVSALSMSAQAVVGYKFASSTLLYNLAAIYGSTRINDDYEIFRNADVYSRIGAR